MFNASYLRETREARGLTQRQAARLADVSLSQYRNVELARCEPTAGLVGRLAFTFSVEPNDLITVPRRVRPRAVRSRTRSREAALMADAQAGIDHDE